MTISTIDIAWVAGLIEGEGTIIAYESKSDRVKKQVRFAVEMTDLDVLQKLQRILGTNARLIKRNPPSLNPNHRDSFIVTLSGSYAIAWLLTIYCFLGTRRRAAVIKAVNLWKTMKNALARYATCQVCGKKFLMTRIGRSTLCGRQACHKEYGRVNANKR